MATIGRNNRMVRRTGEAVALASAELRHRGYTVLSSKQATMEVRAPSGRIFKVRCRSLSTSQSDWIIRTSTTRTADVWLLVRMGDHSIRVLTGDDAERLMLAQNERLRRPADYSPQGIHGREAERFESRWDLLPA